MNKDQVAEDILRECEQMQRCLDLVESQLNMFIEALEEIDESALQKLFHAENDTMQFFETIHPLFVNIHRFWHQLTMGDISFKKLRDDANKHEIWVRNKKVRTF